MEAVALAAAVGVALAGLLGSELGVPIGATVGIGLAVGTTGLVVQPARMTTMTVPRRRMVASA
jgi:hypothetical protein